jgi:hypothetical protein
MARARQETEWDRAAALMALTANCHRDPRKHRPFMAEDFHPLRRRAAETTPGTRITAANIGLLKIFCGKGKRP